MTGKVQLASKTKSNIMKGSYIRISVMLHQTMDDFIEQKKSGSLKGPSPIQMFCPHLLMLQFYGVK